MIIITNFTIVLSLLIFFFTSSIILYIKWQDSENRLFFSMGKFNPYKPKPIMNGTEKKLFDIILSIQELNNYYIFPQLHLSTFLATKPDAKDLKNRFEYLNSLYVDFAIFDNELKPALIIELNGSSHNLDFRKSRDQFIQKVLKENKIKMMTINVLELANAERVSQKIIEFLT